MIFFCFEKKYRMMYLNNDSKFSQEWNAILASDGGLLHACGVGAELHCSGNAERDKLADRLVKSIESGRLVRQLNGTSTNIALNNKKRSEYIYFF